MTRARILAMGRAAAATSLVAATLMLPAMSHPATAAGGAVRHNVGFTANSLKQGPDAGDKSSETAVPLGFTADFFGDRYDSVWVNENGNITFEESLSAYTPQPLDGTARKIIAPFWADVDTRGEGSNVTSFGQGRVDGHRAFAVTWDGVGYWWEKTDKLNSFQLVLIEREDVGLGAFDIEFNYDQVQWDTGDASQGILGSSARVGYANTDAKSFELPGSADSGAFLDSNTTKGLVHRSVNSNVPGRFVFAVRQGLVEADTTPPGAPTAPNLVATSDSGLSRTDDVTSNRTPRFRGSAEPGSRVVLSVDGVRQGSGITSGGTYSITTSRLPRGRHVVTATATDADRNRSDVSPSTRFRIVTGSPCKVNPVHPGRARTGNGGGNALQGSRGADLLSGRGGADRVSARGGADCVEGGAGSDRLNGQGGNDQIDGGPGGDTIAPGSGKDLITGGGGNDRINARDGVRERINCGAGRRDFATGDRRDRFVGCEKRIRR